MSASRRAPRRAEGSLGWKTATYQRPPLLLTGDSSPSSSGTRTAQRCPRDWSKVRLRLLGAQQRRRWNHRLFMREHRTCCRYFLTCWPKRTARATCQRLNSAGRFRSAFPATLTTHPPKLQTERVAGMPDACRTGKDEWQNGQHQHLDAGGGRSPTCIIIARAHKPADRHAGRSRHRPPYIRPCTRRRPAY